MVLQVKSVKVIVLVSLLVATLFPSHYEVGASGYVPRTWWVTSDLTATVDFGEGSSCSSPDLAVDTSVNSTQISTLFDDHVLSGDVVAFCPGTYYISETIEIDNNREITVMGPDPTGAHYDSVILDGKNTSQIMRVTDGASLTLVGFVMRNGRAGQSTVSNDCVTSSACGGAVGIMTTGTVIIYGMQLRNNYATEFGGAVAINGGQGYSASSGLVETCVTAADVACQDSRVIITQNLFQQNSSDHGGAIGSLAHNFVADSTRGAITSNTFDNNLAIESGMALDSQSSWLNVLNNTFVQPLWSQAGIATGWMSIRNNILAVEGDPINAPATSITCDDFVVDMGGNLGLDGTCGFDRSIEEWSPFSGLSYVLTGFEDFGLTELRTFGDELTPMYGITQWSAAIQGGTPFADCHDTDQRGAVRMAAPDSVPGSDLNCDTGAFERLISSASPQFVDGGFPSGDGRASNPFEVSIGQGIEFDIPNTVAAELYDPSLDTTSSISVPYTSWSIGGRTLTANFTNQAGSQDPFVYEFEFVYPFDHTWANCNSPSDVFCVESATLAESGISLRNTNDLNVQFNVEFLDGGNGVTSFNWSVGTWNVGVATDLPDEIEDATIVAVIRTGGFVPRMTTSYSKNLRIDVSASGGNHTLTITGSPTEVNTLTGSDPEYSLCASSGACGDESTQASYNAIIFSGNSQDLHTWGSDADTFAGFYSAQNAQYGPTISVLALQFRVYPEAFWELTLGNPHLAVSGEVATGQMNAWMPGSYFESLGTTTTAALAVGFTVVSEETTDEGVITQVVPADISEVNGGLMVSLDDVSYSTNKIRVYNRADTGIQVLSAGNVDGTSTNQTALDFVFAMDRTVTDVSIDDFEFADSTTATGCEIDGVDVQGTNIHVYVSGCSDAGDVALRLKANSLSFSGLIGPTEAFTSTLVTIDSIRPGVIRFNSSERSPSNKTSIQYTLQFDEVVQDLSGSDFVNAGTATGCRFATNQSTGSNFTITITRCSTMGTLKPRLINSGIADLAGNSPETEWVQTAVVIKLDRVAPKLVFKAVTVSRTKSRTLSFTVAGRSRSEELKCSTVTAADFVITKGKFVSSRTRGNACLITVKSTIATTATGTTQVAKSRALSITDTAGNRHSGLSGLSINWTILR